MNFNEFLEEQLTNTRNVLASKEAEYASDNDRLHNFRHAALMIRSTPEEALLGMMVKHLVSFVDLMKDPTSATPELINEKCGDTINYTLLAQYMLLERISSDINPHIQENTHGIKS